MARIETTDELATLVGSTVSVKLDSTYMSELKLVHVTAHYLTVAFADGIQESFRFSRVKVFVD